MNTCHEKCENISGQKIIMYMHQPKVPNSVCASIGLWYVIKVLAATTIHKWVGLGAKTLKPGS